MQPFDTGLTAKTLDTVMDVRDAEKWDKDELSSEYKALHPYVLLRSRDILLTSVMLVFQKPS